MTKEIERAGIPIVQICNLVNIAEGIGSNRILQGKSVLHALGDRTLPPETEFEYREGMVEKPCICLKNSRAEKTQPSAAAEGCASFGYNRGRK